MSASYFLVLLVLVPILAYRIARRRLPSYRFCMLGITFGAVASPLATGLYSLYFLSPWGVIPGFLGLALMSIHGVPGFSLATHFGLIPGGVVSDGRSDVIIDLINGVIWAAVYGAIGLAIDKFRIHRSRGEPTGA